MLTGPIPNSLGNLKDLDCLHLYDNDLTNDAPGRELSFLTSLTNCPKLRDLVVSDNPLRGFLPPSVGNLSSSLIRIYASNCMITGEIPRGIGNLSSLNNLDIAGNDISGFVPTTVSGLRRLQGLFLSQNTLRGLLPDSLCDMPELSYLKLSGNQISGPIPECIGNVTSLRRIDLASNRLSSTVPSSLWNLNDVLELDLSSNFFGGDLPREIQNLKVAVYINLSSNGFTSVVPDAFGTMQDLINFSLASNNLQGSIPNSLSKMISLVSLDLSNNSLSGEIPKELEELKYLTYFNVSFNELSGEIPSGGPFGNFGYLSFVSNEALCGATPQLRVPRCSSSSSHQKKGRRKVLLIVSVIVALLIIITCSVLVISWVMRRRRKPAPSEADQYYSSCQSREMERFTYHQLKHATNNFSDGNLLGSGGFSSVYLASFENGVLFAVKVFNLEQERASKSFETECEMLSKLRHRNLTKVVSACSNLDFKALLLEYMRNGSLEDWLYCEGYSLDMLQRLNVAIDVASALDYLHHGYVKLVVHCDLKPSNVLLDGDMVGHVADFGITKLLGEGEEQSIVHTQTLATMGYMAPGK